MARMPSRFLLCTVLVKMLIYGSIRMLYSFSHFLAADWGFTGAELSVVQAVGELAGIPGGFLATLGDKYGNRAVGIGASAMFFLSSLAMLAPVTFASVVVVRVVLISSGMLYIIVNQSALVGSLGQESVGWFTGISETSWSLSILTFVPAVAAAYKAFSWRAPFAIAAVLAGLALPEVLADFPHDNDRLQAAAAAAVAAEADGAGSKKRNKGSRYWQVLTLPGPILFNISSLLFNLAHNLVFIGFVNWAVEEHGLDETQIGVAGFAIGVAELLGSLTIVYLGDRSDIYKVQYAACAVFALAILGFTLLAHVSMAMGVAFVCLIYMPGDAAIIAQIAVAERFVCQDLRTTLLGMNFQCHFIGRAVGAVIAEQLWEIDGLRTVGLTGFAIAVVTIVFIWLAERYLPELEKGDNDAAGDEAPGNANSYAPESTPPPSPSFIPGGASPGAPAVAAALSEHAAQEVEPATETDAAAEPKQEETLAREQALVQA